MTKQWAEHESTIRSLYREKTLAEVRKVMIEQHGFKASTRAYRGKLIKWGVRKYRRRSDCSGGHDGSSSGSEVVSPTLSHPDGDLRSGMMHYPAGGFGRHNEPRLANLLDGPSFDDSEILDRSRMYPSNYGTTVDERERPPRLDYCGSYSRDSNNNSAFPPTHNRMRQPYVWDVSPTQSTAQPQSLPPPTHHHHFGPADMMGGIPGHIYPYPLPLPLPPPTYSECAQTERHDDGRRDLLPSPLSSSITGCHHGGGGGGGGGGSGSGSTTTTVVHHHDGPAAYYSAGREYQHGPLPILGISSFENRLQGRVPRHMPEITTPGWEGGDWIGKEVGER